MSIEETSEFSEKEDNAINHPQRSSRFGFKPCDTEKHQGTTISISDSAYNSMVCSPFSPILSSKPLKSISPRYHLERTAYLETISPYLESNENDDVFKLSMEQINAEPIPSSRGATFRPISVASDHNRFTSRTDCTSSQIQIQTVYPINNVSSRRSVSTQTKFSMSSMAMYRPSSAPLYEGIEDELEEINMDRMTHNNSRMHTNSACFCIRSPMPDLIQPAFQNHNQFLGSQLSLIADQIDEAINPQVAVGRGLRRRRSSTPSIAELTPGGSLVDLVVNICNALDISVSRLRQRGRDPSLGNDVN